MLRSQSNISIYQEGLAEVDLEQEAKPEWEGVEFSLEREASIYHVTISGDQIFNGQRKQVKVEAHQEVVAEKRVVKVLFYLGFINIFRIKIL